jgi:uncharacterized hydrophobic protein (TIGR00271 family)
MTRMGALLGITGEARARVVDGLFDRPHDEVAAYWLQLGLAIAIATLGLVMGSGGVIIGAMLVAPLMGPIVELALSLLVGAGSVMLGSAARIAASVALAIGAAAIATAILPFNEPSAEILARTTPTVLDLLVAMCCAVAAAFVTVRPSGAASTAAGTSIGISLVPPLCTVGFGIGTGNAAIAEGALLLFVANLTAILACATLFFWLVGFEPLPAGTFAGRTPGHYGFGGVFAEAGRRLDRGIASRFHLLWRLAVPLSLVAAVAVPLESAYQEMVWQVRMRTLIAHLVQDEPMLNNAVSISSVAEHYRIAFRAVVVGDEAAAARLRRMVAAWLQESAGVVPLVTITAVPHASAEATPPSLPLHAVADAPALPVAPDEAVRQLTTAIESRLSTAWPPLAGTLVDHALTIRADGLDLRIVALGEGLEPTAIAMLERELGDLVARPVQVTLLSVPVAPITAAASAGRRWLDDAAPRVATIANAAPGLRLCVTAPPLRSGNAAVHAAIDGWTSALGAERVVVEIGEAWLLRLVTGSCAIETPGAGQPTTPSLGQEQRRARTGG